MSCKLLARFPLTVLPRRQIIYALAPCHRARLFSSNTTPSDGTVDLQLPRDVARRLNLYHQEQERQYNLASVVSGEEPKKKEDSNIVSNSDGTPEISGILDSKILKKRFTEDSDMEARDEARYVYWHSAAHVLGQAIELCLSKPHVGTSSATEAGEDQSTRGAKEFSYPLLCDGPPIVGEGAEQGFYYQFALPNGKVVSDEDLQMIEKEMQRIVREPQHFERLEVDRCFAKHMFKDNKYKLDMLNRIPDTEPITLFRNGTFVDLCRGPHIKDTSAFGAIKVLSCSAAHFRMGASSSNNKEVNPNPSDTVGNKLVPVQRIYGIAFPKPKQLRSWEKQMKLAQERDHRTIGTSQELFMFDKSSPGSPFFLPHGTRILNRIMSQVRSMYWKDGYDEVRTPLIFHKDLWEQSGHLENYADDMYGLQEGLAQTVDGANPINSAAEDLSIGLKPMNCPAHCLMFKARKRSYRELPIRLADFGSLHRNENTGSLRGLTRVRCFHQDDAHIFCRPDQLQHEVAACLEFINEIYSKMFGLAELRVHLSTRPPNRVGSDESWDKAESALVDALEAWGHTYSLNKGDGAFYGPKIDVRVKDALGRWHQCATVQLDFNLPQRFDLSYEHQEGPQRPVIVHRAVLGSLERMVAILCEHWGGRWPLWISPRQVAIVPVNDTLMDHAVKVQENLRRTWSRSTGIVGEPLHDEIIAGIGTLKKRISAAQRLQYNYILVIGDEEAKNGTVNVRNRDGKIIGEVEVSDFVSIVQDDMRAFK